MNQRSALIALVSFLLCLTVLYPGLLQADIYMYRDRSGVIHFSNVPTSPKYRIYLRTRGISRPSRTHYNPDQYDHLITKASESCGIDFSLVKAMIKVESNFNPNAISPKGAKGLMQIMPQNYYDLGISDPFDPWESIYGGTRYLRQMLIQFNGDTHLALAAYNAGPDRVQRYQSIPPFPETRNYVTQVMRFYQQFQKS